LLLAKIKEEYMGMCRQQQAIISSGETSLAQKVDLVINI
jgi:hypothetical protein